MTLSRRQFVGRSAAGVSAGVGVSLAGSVAGLSAAGPALAAADPTAGGGPGSGPGYGPLVPDPRGLLDLPKGFGYRVVSRTGEPLASGGGRVPERLDGMAAFPAARGLLLVRNHEVQVAADPRNSTRASVGPDLVYDPSVDGGTTTLRLDRRGRLDEEYVSLAGTSTNCAGGRTPWGTWLSCEETETPGTKPHGWVFEVDPRRPERNRNPEPLTAMGRYAHEAVAFDGRTGEAYLTEDAGSPNGLFYRFTPTAPHGGYGSLRGGGRLHAMVVRGVPDLSAVDEVGRRFRVDWVRVPDPLATSTSTRKQFDDGEVTRSRKLEGAWSGPEGVYFVASYARPEDGSAAAHDGQVWLYRPGAGTLELVLVFRPGDTAYDAPDNITVSPYGGVILAEDGEGTQHLIGATEDGEPFTLARNALNDSEFAGVTFSPDGRVLFANIQEPGITLAIAGPWRNQRRQRHQRPSRHAS